MRWLMAFLGWRYILDVAKSEFHHYKCVKLEQAKNTMWFNRDGMLEEYKKNSFNIKLCKCIDLK